MQGIKGQDDKRNWAVEQSRGRDGDSGVMHSPPVWQVSIEGLKAVTLVPNHIRILPQMHVTCG